MKKMVKKKTQKVLDIILWLLGLTAVGILLYGIIKILIGNG